MKYQAKPDEHLWITSMGKKFRVRAITDNVDEANEFMERHKETALIACYGPFNLIANVYEGLGIADQNDSNHFTEPEWAFLERVMNDSR